MDVPAAITGHRLAIGLTQAELARRAHLPRPNLSAIEAGRRDLTVGTLARIARALGVPPAALLEPPAPRRTNLGKVSLDTVALAVVTGRRGLGAEVDRLADAMSWRCQASLEACGAPGASRGSRRAWTRGRLEWDGRLIEALDEKIRKFLASDLKADGTTR